MYVLGWDLDKLQNLVFPLSLHAVYVNEKCVHVQLSGTHAVYVMKFVLCPTVKIMSGSKSNIVYALSA